MKLAVTGATSAIGQSVCIEASAAHHDVVRLVRSPAPGDRLFDLQVDPATSILDGIDAVIHLAWQWSRPGVTYRQVNVDGSRRLFDVAAHQGIRVVLLSTFSAFSHGRSEYAECKRALEYDLHGERGVTVRAGLVWGYRPAGIAKMVLRLAALRKICCHLRPDPLLYQTEVAALARLLVAAATGGRGETSLWAAWPEPLNLSEIAHAVRGTPPWYHAKIPAAPVRVILAGAERAGFLLPMRSDSFGGILRPGDVPSDPNRSHFMGGFPDNRNFLSWIEEQSRA